MRGRILFISRSYYCKLCIKEFVYVALVYFVLVSIEFWLSGCFVRSDAFRPLVGKYMEDYLST